MSYSYQLVYLILGWRFSRMGEVLVHHVSHSAQVQQRALTLVDSAGCRDIRMKAVCPDNPAQTSPLVSTLALRAFMFQGMASGDEMVMSVRMIACLHYEDCHSKVMDQLTYEFISIQ